jgi:signal transduction histidine kinase
MFESIAGSLGSWLRKAAKANKRVQTALFLLIVSPVVLFATVGFIGTYRDLTDFTLSRREAIARLAAIVLEQRLGRMTDLGISLATRVRFRQLASEGHWVQAIEILKDVPKDFPFVDRIFLSDPAGTLMADMPALPGVRGKSFAFREWYQGVSAAWNPYISDVYQRTAEPRFNVVALAFPIKAPQTEKITGILVLQVQLDELAEWSDSVGIGPSGHVYFVDRKGRLATHPKSPSQGKLVDYSSVPVVHKVLQGLSGVEVTIDPLKDDERIAAYAPVAGVGWGVIASEPIDTAFERRNSVLEGLLLRHGTILVISCILAYVILRTVIGLTQAEEKIKGLNTDLQRRANELEAANQELEAFSYSVSHDLRSPLRAIDGFSQALLEDCSDQLDDHGKDFLARVSAGSQRMAQLIDDLLDLSRVTRSAFAHQPVNLSIMAESVLAGLKKTEPQRQVDCAITANLTVTGDERLLRVAIENLLGNAWKFTGKRAAARIEFGMIRNGDTPTYYVRDNGAGFDMAYMDKLFGPFQRLHAMKEFEGTGIGLATVQRIIHRHGGQVWAEAEVGKGATFHFTLG